MDIQHCVNCSKKVIKETDVGINLPIYNKVVCKKCFQEAD
jgi:hypothetical protein